MADGIAQQGHLLGIQTGQFLWEVVKVVGRTRTVVEICAVIEAARIMQESKEAHYDEVRRAIIANQSR